MGRTAIATFVVCTLLGSGAVIFLKSNPSDGSATNDTESLRKTAVVADRFESDETSLAKASADQPLPPHGENVPANIFDVAADLTHAVSKTADEIGQQIVGLSDIEERDYGKRMFHDVFGLQRFDHNPALLDRLHRIARPLLERRRRKAIDYHFSVLDSPELNAFSTLGGYVYVNRGLLDTIGDDRELEFVIGHEIGHVDLGHCAQNVAYLIRGHEMAGDLAGSVVQLLYKAMELGYSEDKEFAADEYSLRRLLEMGRDRRDSLRALQRFQTPRGSAEPRGGSGGWPDDAARAIENHFRSHPSAIDRMHRLEAIDLDRQ